MFSAAEEVIFALRTQGMSQKGIAARVGCARLKTSPQDDRTLKRIAHSNRFKSTTSITHLWNETMTSPVSRSITYRRLRFHGFSSRIPCTKPLLSCKQKKKRLQFAQSISSGRWRTGSTSSSLMNRNSSWVMATRDLVFGGKSTKGTQGSLSEALCQASGLRYGLGMCVIPRSWKFVLLVSQDDSQHGGVHRSARCLPASICR